MTTVAIDGPSGSGKSTISRAIARELGMGYLDTGAMYRCATWWCHRRGVDLTDRAATAAAVAAVPWIIGTDPLDPRFVVDGVDVTGAIRETRIATEVSKVATNLAVRAWMKEAQRAIIAAAPAGIIAEGRDITTVIAPDADVRILLVADESARLARRAREVHGSDDPAALAATADQVVRRDADDSTVSNFRMAADGVITVDSTHLTLPETIAAVRELVLGA
ncbi:(d)CMP kinase [Pseudactinotalea sp. HY158]|uniref:(d)CMP kinase n=1 Tax=unclassified Pseudactinotalea TaxID=2649176 RepID=UPI00129C609B|nr:(d)CMP kinase [Pseudactinotalea sp. HY158]MPV49990.1 (d)CMP kinase [Pseudactinotalea sp. HY160]QGH69249.1 (d)CMP kinase [Pseudactinotalea sp. HY158]